MTESFSRYTASAPSQAAEGWTIEFLQRATEEAIGFAVKEGLTVMYVTEDTTRADPASLRALLTTALRTGATRLCIADTVGHATPETWRDGANALLVPPGDATALAGALTKLVHAPELRASIGAAGAALGRGHTWDGIAAATLGLYRAPGAGSWVPGLRKSGLA